MRCAMCGYDFDETGLACHQSCPISSGCAVICCPRCGYSTVDPARSTVSSWLQRVFKKRPRADQPAGEGAIPLLSLRPDQPARVVALGEGHPDELLHLSHFGLMPGIPIQLRQLRPVPIIRIGETDLALDRAVAAEISVEVV